MILMIDNYDSFTFNLVQELAALGAPPIEVVRNDAEPVGSLLERRPAAIVISPGPGTPSSAGVTVELVEAAASTPLLGICLGHQALAVAAGGRVARAPEPVHGKTSPVRHRGTDLFEGIPDPFEATRYHSLVVERAGSSWACATAIVPTTASSSTRSPISPATAVRCWPPSCGWPASRWRRGARGGSHDRRTRHAPPAHPPDRR